jgi:hypothetical protein
MTLRGRAAPAGAAAASLDLQRRLTSAGVQNRAKQRRATWGGGTGISGMRGGMTEKTKGRTRTLSSRPSRFLFYFGDSIQGPQAWQFHCMLCLLS